MSTVSFLRSREACDSCIHFYGELGMVPNKAREILADRLATVLVRELFDDHVFLYYVHIIINGYSIGHYWKPSVKSLLWHLCNTLQSRVEITAETWSNLLWTCETRSKSSIKTVKRLNQNIKSSIRCRFTIFYKHNLKINHLFSIENL